MTMLIERLLISPASSFMLGSILILVHAQHQPHFKPHRSVIVHLFEWKFDDVANECETFLGPKGFGGVQVSPINENLVVKTDDGDRPWWERYQPISYKIITRSGNKDEFSDMVRRCNESGIRIYVDVVLNHMAAPADEMIGTGGSPANASLLSFPAVPYNPEDFHTDCTIENYQDAYEIRNCKLGTLPDIDHSHDNVVKIILAYLDHLIDLGVAGFRIDAAKHMWPPDIEKLTTGVKDLNTDFDFPDAARPFFYQEVIDFGGEAISKTEYNSLGVVTEFLYGAELGTVFRGKSNLNSLINWGSAMGFLPSQDALVFVDNHDNQRGHGAGGSMILTFKEPKLYQRAAAFMLAHPFGIPRVMSSYRFNSTDEGPPADEEGNILSPTFDDNNQCEGRWVCEHRWNAIANMVQFRNVVEGEGISNWQEGGPNQIAFCLGDKGFIAINNDPQQDFKQKVTACVPPGVYCDVISGVKLDNACSGSELVVDQDNKANILIPKDAEVGVISIHAQSRLD